jgi:PST family polysaccharide transporter
LLLAGLSLPLFLFPSFFVQLILGDQWLAVIPLLRILIVAGWIHSLALLCHSYLLALGKYKTVNYYLGISTSLMVILMLTLAPRHGMMGALWAILIARLIAVPFILFSVFSDFSQNNSHAK